MSGAGAWPQDVPACDELDIGMLLRGMPDAIVALYDPDLRCLMLEGPMLRRGGFDPRDYVGRPIKETLPPEQYEQLEPLIRAGLAGQSCSAEWTSTVSGITYEVEVAPHHSADGSIAGAFAVARDVDERNARIRALAESERMLAEAQAIAHVGSWELDLTADRVRWSAELCRIAGRPLGITPTLAELLEMVHPDDRHLISGQVDSAVAGQPSTSEYRLVRPDGEIRHVLTTRFARTDVSGRITHLYGSTQDITERVQRERELRHLASIVEHSGEAITSKDAEGTFTEWNRGAEQLYGYSAAEAVGRPVSLIVPEDRQGEEKRLLERALNGETVEQFQTQRLRKDGSIVDVSITVSPLRDHLNQPVGASVITRDVSAQATAESEREKALTALAEAQGIAHVGSWTWDADADTATWSDEMYRIFGRDPSDEPLTGEEFFACLHPDDRRRAAAGRPSRADAPQIFDLDYRFVTDAGAERIMHVRGRREDEGRYAGTVQDVTQLRATERALAYSAEFFRAALEQAPIGIAIVSPEGRWLTVNREVCELTGYSEQELLAMSFQDITHPDDLDVDLAQKSALLSDELRTYANKKRYIRKDGSVVWVQLSSSLIRDERGEPVHFVTHIQDITGERQAHEALAKSERRYQSIATNVPGMVYRFTLSGSGEPRVLFASSGCNEIYGITPEQLMAAPHLVLDGVHPDDQPAWKETVAASAAQLSRWTWDGRHLAPDGSVRYLHAVAQPSLEDDGTVVWDGVVSDVTEVREAERARDEALEHFEAAFDRAPIGMGVASTAGRIERVNEALSWITGYSADELCSLTTMALVHPDDLEQVERECEALQHGEDAVTYTHRLEHAAGHVIWVQVSLTMLRDAAGAALHTLVQMIDVSEQRVYEDELQHMAEHDPLTSLLNRRGFEAALGAHLARCQRYGAGGALLMLDLDGFKAVNDTLGHAAGDEVIKTAAAALTTRLRQSDVIARLGGDEFAVLLPTQTRDEAEAVAEALLETIRTSAIPGHGGQAGLVSASIGIALVLDGQFDAEALVANADVAMYASKTAGKGRYTVYGAGGTVTSAS